MEIGTELIIGFYVDKIFSNKEYKEVLSKNSNFSEQIFVWANSEFAKTGLSYKVYFQENKPKWKPVYTRVLPFDEQTPKQINYSNIEKRPYVNAQTHSTEALQQYLISDEVVPDRTDSLFQQYPFLKNKINGSVDMFEYDNSTYYENARWLILTMAQMVTELQQNNKVESKKYDQETLRKISDDIDIRLKELELRKKTKITEGRIAENHNFQLYISYMILENLNDKQT